MSQQLTKKETAVTTDQPLVQGFINIHTALRSDLQRFENGVKRSGQLNAKGIKGLSRYFELFWTVLESHHLGEDEFFYPAIARYAPDFLNKMGTLTEEHHQIDEYVNNIRATFQQLGRVQNVTERQVTTMQLIELVGSFRSHLVHHLEREEGIMFPVIAAGIPVKDQDELHTTYVKKSKLKDVSLEAPWFLQNLPPADSAALYNNAPWIMKVLYHLSWKRKYERLVASFQG